MSLGILRRIGHEGFEYLEWQYKKQLQDLATRLWPLVQGGTGEEALELWKDIWCLLELDADSWMDLMLLTHQGPVGRSEANKILWDLLTRYAVTSEFKNLSRKASSLMSASRRAIDRPPDNHRDLDMWTWRKALDARYPEFLASTVPADPRVVTEEGGVPRPPPGCWQPPPPPPPEGPQEQQGGPQSQGGPQRAAPSDPIAARTSKLKWRS